MNDYWFDKFIERVSNFTDEELDLLLHTMKQNFEERHPGANFYEWMDSQMPEDDDGEYR